jgi:hypothetical protein
MVLILTQMVFFKGFICFFNLAEEAYLEQNEPFSTLKTMICRKYSFQKQTQFSQGNNVLDATASNIDGFLWRGSCVFSIQLNRPIWSKQSLCTPWTHKLQEYSFQKLTPLSQGINVLDASATNTDGFLQEIHLFHQLSWRGLQEQK